MKKVVLLAFVLVLSSMFGTQLVITVSGSIIHHVYSGESIQEAINLAQSGDTIFVHNGTYYEHVVVNKSISLIGENRSTTVIDGSGTGDVVLIDIFAHHVNVTGFTMRNGTNGIIIKYSDFNTISGNIVTDNQYGIYLFSDCSCNFILENTIRNNTIKNNGIGIRIKISKDNVIYHNNFIDNTQQVDIEGTWSYANLWDDDYPSGGNYWSDYEERYPDAEELDGSGIWNTTYFIDENNRDRYPLMRPWSPGWSPKPRVEEEIPFWMQWWFWAIVAAGIVVLAGTVYFLKKRKPPTPTAPPLPPEGTTQNINPLNS